MIKFRVFSLTILAVLLLGVIQVTSANLSLDQGIKGKTILNNQEYQVPDFETEIQPIDQPELSVPNTFDPSPISLNSLSPEVSSKVTQADEERLIIQIDLEKTITQPGQPLKYIIQASRGLNPASGERLKLEIIKGEDWGWYHYYYYDTIEYEDRIVEQKIVTTDADGQYEGVFQTSNSGRYSIIIRDEWADNYYKSRSFNIADVGIFWRVSREFVKGQPHYSVAYVLNTSDFSPIIGATVTLTGELYDYHWESRTYSVESEHLFGGISDAQGITEITFTPPSNFSENYNFMANLSVTYNGETTYVLRNLYRGGYYWTSDGYQEFTPYEFIVTTDKPIYNPGETVQARILLWHNDYLKATKEPVSTSFILKLLTPSQHTLFQKTLTTNSYGVAEYSFELDLESELGDYSIITQKEEVISTTDIRVDKYEKPAYRVEIELDKEYVAPGQKVSGILSAIYYFGKPVINGEVELKIGELSTLSGVTDEDGLWTFSYTLPKSLENSGLHALSLNATVIDTVDREVTVSTSVQITEDVYVYAWVNPWFPKADENVSLYFGAYQYTAGLYYWRSYQPMPEAPVTIKLYGLISNTVSIYLTSYQTQTDANGYGRYEFAVPQEILVLTTRFKGVIELNSDDGRTGESTFYFSVDLLKADVSLDSETYSPGETVNVNVNLLSILTFSQLSGSVRVRIFDADYELIGEKSSDIPTSGGTFSFQLSSFAPNGRYYVHIYVRKTFTYEWGSYNYYKYDTSVTFTVGSSQELLLNLDKPSYSLGDSMTISGQLQGETNAPIMIQFVKKGILTTQYIPQNTVSSFSLTVSDISLFAPKVWIYGFAILTTGVVQEVRLYVEIDPTLTVEIESNKNTYTPGEEAEINIQVYDANKNPISTVLAISFIDSSVFGVEPDPESELEHFKEQQFWPSVWTVTSWKSRQFDWWFWWYDDFYGFGYPSNWRGGGGFFMEEDYAVAGDQGTKSPSEAPVEADVGQKIRDNLPENAYWMPFVVVEDGSISISIVLPDTIGEWTVRVVATSTTSGIGTLEKYAFKTFIPFFVEIVKDPFVLQDDIFIIKGVVYNYLGELTDIDVSIDPADGITVLGDDTQRLKLPSDFLGSISWACLAEDANFVNVTLYATTELNNGSRYSDAIRKAVDIIPNGVETEFKTSGFVYQDPQFDYFRYTESVKQVEFLELSLGLGSTAISSWERLVGYPYGCTEQTISRVVPDTLILDYLNETNQLTNETKDLLTDMIVTGLSRLYSQQHHDGGWGWWSSDSSRIYMTSLVLYGLSAVRDVGIYVEPSVVKEALYSILEKQNSDGSWTVDSWRNIDKVAFTAFALRSLIYWSSELSDLDPINDALAYISSTWNGDSTKRSSYLAALYLDAVMDSPFGSAAFESSVLAYLLSEVQLSGNGNFWKYTTSFGYYWRALGGDVEITGLALKALVKSDPAAHMPIIRGAVQWMLGRQSRWGWGNTADTSAAISSLITISKEGFSSNDDANVSVFLNEEEIGNYNLSVSGDSVIYLNLKSYIQPGENNFTFSKSGTGNVSYYFYGHQTLRSLPDIVLPAKISVGVDQEVNLPIQLSPTSTAIFAANLTINPVQGDILPIINLPQTIQLLTQVTTLNFRYEAPSIPGTYSIPGFEISYLLSDSAQSSFSPGILSRQYGPIELEVLSSIEGMLPTSISIPEELPEPKVQMSRLMESSVTGLTLEREFSSQRNIQPGDLIIVTLRVTNANESMNFLMLEESIPAGFSLDPSTIKHSQETYTITSVGITFFFSQLPEGDTQVKYGLIASNIRQSLVIPSKLSSMYDDWMVKSTPAVLGEARVPIDPLTGQIIKDLTYPSLINLELSEIRESTSPYLRIQVTAEDNWGVASVKVYIKQSTWVSFDCFDEGDQWIAKGRGLSTGNAQVYVEIMDYAGNIYITSQSTHVLELGAIIIPFIPIISLIVFAFATGAGLSTYVRKRRI